MYKKRQNDIIDYAKQKESIDYIFLMNPKTIYYYTGFYANPHERFFLFCIDVKAQTTFLFLPSLDLDGAKEVADVDNFIPVSDNENGYETLTQYIHMSKDDNVLALEKDYVTIEQYEKILAHFTRVQINNIEPFVRQTRLRKSSDEIVKVKYAIDLTEKALHQLLPQVKLGMTEAEIKALLEYELKLIGAERIAFETMVLTGANSASPHGAPGNRPIEVGDFLLFDFGIYVDHYCSDITRTFVIGEATEKQEHIYNTVLQANEKAIEAVQLGAPLKEIDIAARSVIEEAGYGEYFTHRTGHGLGLDVHEAPSIHFENEAEIMSGLLFTIEPGIYIQGFGGVRIEDDIYIHENGEVEVLTSFPKQLIIIDAK